jgi:phosphoglycolate phosphatase-like HAD superfamily hydrolase
VKQLVIRGFLAAVLIASGGMALANDPLPSWNEGPSKSAIIAFVEDVTRAGSDTFVPVSGRIATFDNDGTLWSEQPLYFQAFFAVDQIRRMAPDHPDWATTEPFKSVLAGDIDALRASGEAGIVEFLLAAHSGMTAAQFSESVARWAGTARHPSTGKPFTQMIFQPMLELLEYLRANQFKTYIVSGGGVDFLRVLAEDLYGVPPEQVVGTTIDARFEMRDGEPTIVKQPKIVLIDDKAGKPVGIYRHIGRRPIFAAGNSDGDLQMLQYATLGSAGDSDIPRMGLLVRHTDAEREYAYDRESHVGRLDEALEEAEVHGWVVVDMQREWKSVYPEVGSEAGADARN